MSAHRTLILGESQSGKTHFVGQILGRTRSGLGALRLERLPESLQMVEEVLDRLAQGLAASHTPAGFYKETEFELTNRHDKSVQLIWPDYAGEQITEIVTKRALRPEWASRIEAADSWTLLVRLSAIVRRKTALEQVPSKKNDTVPVSSSVESNSNQSEEDPLPEQMRLIELLQILRHCRYRTNKPVPPLMIVVTCVDELGGFETPRAALRDHLPQFISFVEANWPTDKLRYWGLSSLGMDLSETEPNKKFAEEGPEKQGYVVDMKGQQDPDLTLPFAEFLAVDEIL